MFWFVVWTVLALGATALLLLLGLGLWRKLRALATEVAGLRDRAEELAAVLDRIQLPEEPADAVFDSDSTVGDHLRRR